MTDHCPECGSWFTPPGPCGACGHVDVDQLHRKVDRAIKRHRRRYRV